MLTPEQLKAQQALNEKKQAELRKIRSLMEKAIVRFYGEDAFKNGTGIYAEEQMQKVFKEQRVIPSLDREERKKYMKASQVSSINEEIQARLNDFVKKMDEVDLIINEEARMVQYDKRMQEVLTDPTNLGGRFATSSAGKAFRFTAEEKEQLNRSVANLNQIMQQKEATKKPATTPTKQPEDGAKRKEQIEKVGAALLDVTDFLEFLATEKGQRSQPEQKIRSAYQGVKKGLFSLATGSSYRGKEQLARSLKDELEALKEIAKNPKISPEEIGKLLERTLQKAEIMNKTSHFTLSQDSYQKLLTNLKEKYTQPSESTPKEKPHQ